MDIGHLPHPVLMHLRSFFDLWDTFTLQAVQTGQPYISDHLMFEVRRNTVVVIAVAFEFLSFSNRRQPWLNLCVCVRVSTME